MRVVDIIQNVELDSVNSERELSLSSESFVTDMEVDGDDGEPRRSLDDVNIAPITVRIGQREGENYYIVDEVKFERDLIFDLFEADFTEIAEYLDSRMLFAFDEFSPGINFYPQYRDTIVQKISRKWYNSDDEFDVTVGDITVLESLIDREYLQFGGLTAMFSDPRVDQFWVTLDRVFVEIDGEEYKTNVPVVNVDQLRTKVIELAQRFGEHISSDDPTVQIENLGSPSDVPRDMESVNLELPTEDSVRDNKFISVEF